MVGDALATATGIIEVIAGTGGTAGGVMFAAVSEEGVVPIIAGSTAVAAHGATTTAVGALNAGIGLSNLLFKKGKQSGPLLKTAKGAEKKSLQTAKKIIEQQDRILGN